MSDELLRYYNSELEYLRQLGSEFARAHPRTAGYLNLGEDEEYDPHVGRLIQAFAYLNARTRQKLDDDFPELSASMLEILYPHYLRPIPSLAIMQFSLDRSQMDLTGGYKLPRGTRLESEPVGDQPCRYRTCYDVTCWPVQVAAARYQGLPFTAPPTSFSSSATSLLTLEIETLVREVPLAKLPIDRLRFYLRTQTTFAYQLHELLMNHALGAAVATKPDAPPQILPPGCIQPVGFAENEGLFDYPPRSFLGYRLLSEYFCFPDKFLFFDVQLDGALAGPTSQKTIYVYLDRHLDELQPHVSAATFALGCSPVANLYRHRAEPIRLTHFEAEHRVIPDARQPFGHEVYSIDRVVGGDESRQAHEFDPFYSIRHQRETGRRFWHATRHWNPGTDEVRQGGNEFQISFVDLDFQPAAPATMTIDLELTCLNRNLPAGLPFGGDRPRFQLEEGGAVRRLACLTKPTQTIRPSLAQGTRWRLVSHLTLGHLSLTGGQGLEALREILRLYDFKDSPETRKAINGITRLDCRPAVGRLGGPTSGGLCRGVEVELTLDQEQFKEGGLFLLASVLDRFFALYSNVNAFTQTVVKSSQRDRTIVRWPPRAGEQLLL